MGDISANFSRSEFACKCGCGFDTVDTELLRILEVIRGHFGVPVQVTSGCRCPAYNSSPDVGGAPNSQHLYGRAADIVVADTSPCLVAELADRLGVGGVGSYESFTHVDTRTNGPARW